MKILASEKLSENKYKTKEGYLICVDSILARTGTQQYKKNELFTDADDGEEIIDVDRPREEVFKEETIASFENKPITFEHPDEDVTTENYRDLSVGYVRDVKKGNIDGQDVILGTLVFTDEDIIKKVENKEYEELSCGYDCDLKDINGTITQCNIRGNHVALCEEGRAGIAKVRDSEDEKTYLKHFKDDKPVTAEDVRNLLNEIRKAWYTKLNQKYNNGFTSLEGADYSSHNQISIDFSTDKERRVSKVDWGLVKELIQIGLNIAKKYPQFKVNIYTDNKIYRDWMYQSLELACIYVDVRWSNQQQDSEDSCSDGCDDGCDDACWKEDGLSKEESEIADAIIRGGK